MRFSRGQCCIPGCEWHVSIPASWGDVVGRGAGSEPGLLGSAFIGGKLSSCWSKGCNPDSVVSKIPNTHTHTLFCASVSLRGAGGFIVAPRRLHVAGLGAMYPPPRAGPGIRAPGFAVCRGVFCGWGIPMNASCPGQHLSALLQGRGLLSRARVCVFWLDSPVFPVWGLLTHPSKALSLPAARALRPLPRFPF